MFQRRLIFSRVTLIFFKNISKQNLLVISQMIVISNLPFYSRAKNTFSLYLKTRICRLSDKVSMKNFIPTQLSRHCRSSHQSDRTNIYHDLSLIFALNGNFVRNCGKSCINQPAQCDWQWALQYWKNKQSLYWRWSWQS